MKIDALLTPFFPEKENFFNGAVVIMIDVLRASSTVCAALYHGAKEVIPTEGTEKAIHIYNNLSKQIRFLGGERGGMKPAGFDAGNSPLDYTEETVFNKTVIITTTNGTRVFQKARQAKIRIIAGFVNHVAVTEFLRSYIAREDVMPQLFFLCAGNDGSLSYEDTICAGAYINTLNKVFKIESMTDSAHLAMNLYNLHSKDLRDFLGSREHALKLKNLGFFEDISICLTFDKYPVVPVFTGSIIKKAESET